MKKKMTNLKSRFWRHAIILLIIACSGTKISAFGQELISGKVVDETTNETLIGVSVLVKGTLTGVVTDLDGTFQISAPIGGNF